MLYDLASRWWALALRGLFAVLFGLLTFFVPGITLLTLVLMFGTYAILDGVFDIVSSIRSFRDHWPLMIEGIFGIVIGILTFLWPGITATVLVYIIAFWAIFTGILEIVAGIRLRRFITNEFWLIFMGILSLAFGILIFLFPGAGALALVLWIGAYALVFGVLLIALAFRLRGLKKPAV
jgi:uncharacterized membrane protein HdeD (DUF308 family)